jgi:hypothetical protein
MMNPAQFANRYTGGRVMPFAPPMGHSAPGTCHSCGQPSGQCRCGCRECRKESKELLVEAAANARDPTNLQATMAAAFLKTGAAASANAAGTTTPAAGTAKAFIGGGCCVHLSIEYAPVTPTAATIVIVLVHDSEGTTLAWMKQDPAGGYYQVKENIITTKPGATVTLLVSNATARLRWCEIFSC